MRFDLDMGDDQANQIRGYEKGQIKINDQVYTRSVIVTPYDPITEWEPQLFQELTLNHIKALAAMKPEVLLIGTGEKLIFPSKEILAPLINQAIGFEIMTTQAACRTYNVLMSENRKVVAALIIE